MSSEVSQPEPPLKVEEEKKVEKIPEPESEYLNKDGVDPRKKPKKPLSEAKKKQMEDARAKAAAKRKEKAMIVEEKKEEKKTPKQDGSSLASTIGWGLLGTGLALFGVVAISGISEYAKEKWIEGVTDKVMPPAMKPAKEEPSPVVQPVVQPVAQPVRSDPMEVDEDGIMY